MFDSRIFFYLRDFDVELFIGFEKIGWDFLGSDDGGVFGEEESDFHIFIFGDMN